MGEGGEMGWGEGEQRGCPTGGNWASTKSIR